GNATHTIGRPNFDFSKRFNALMRSRSCGGESHPLRGWGRTAPSGFSHSHPQGLRARRHRAVHPLTDIIREGPTTMSQYPSPLPKSAPHQAPVISTSAGGAILALDLGTTTGWASLAGG